jgi:lipid II isoglutaminyl synthase (glutamine-hydrolysing)
VTATSQLPNRDSAVRIVTLFPDLLGTYGDSGNATVLHKRLAWRGIDAELVSISGGSAVPESGDLYLLGGGEDSPQVQAARELGQTGPLHRAVDRGAVVFAVCAGLQIVGHHFPDSTGTIQPGAGLLDVETMKVDAPRAVGELLVRADAKWSLPVLTGFENHGARTRRGSDAEPLGTVEIGVGNGDQTEGAVTGHVLGTYLHGPALARNPQLADLLLSWVLGVAPADLQPVDDTDAEALRGVRLKAARERELQPRRGWKDVVRRG